MLSCASQVTLEEANAKATQLDIMFMETSAKAGHNVKSLFKKIAMELVGMEKESEATETQNTSTFYCALASALWTYSCILYHAIEIDVTAPQTNEVPDASACNC